MRKDTVDINENGIDCFNRRDVWYSEEKQFRLDFGLLGSEEDQICMRFNSILFYQNINAIKWDWWVLRLKVILVKFDIYLRVWTRRKACGFSICLAFREEISPPTSLILTLWWLKRGSWMQCVCNYKRDYKLDFTFISSIPSPQCLVAGRSLILGHWQRRSPWPLFKHLVGVL